ncbi:hypothetical protein [Actinophytocola sp. KF-1]
MAGTITLTDPGELPRMGAALAAHATAVRGARDAVGPASARLRDRVDRAIDGLCAQVAAAEAALAGAQDPRARADAERRLRDAVARRDQAVALRRQLHDALQEMARAVGAHARAVEDLAPKAVDRLGRFWDQLTGADAAFRAQLARFGAPPAFGRGGVTGAAAARPAAAAGPSAPERAGPVGHVVVDLADIDVSDSGVAGPGSFQHVPFEEMRDGLLLLERVVLPEVRSGAGHARMRELDQLTGRVGAPVSHVRVYEAFFGDTCITLAPGPDGTLTVINGYHRIWLAGRLGIDRLPARVRP